MKRPGLYIVATLWSAVATAQTQYATLDILQHLGSPNIWATPNRGAVVAEAAFFHQEGITGRLRQEDVMVVLSTHTGDGGITHRHYQQRHAGLEVEGAVMITHAQGSELLRANGMVATLPTYDVPSVSAEEALYTVQTVLGLLGPLVDGQDWEVTENVLIYAPRTWDTQGAPLEFRMCYKIGILVFEPYGSTLGYVDAYTGELLRWESTALECSAGSALTLYNGWQGITTKWFNFLTNHYELRDECRGERIHTRVDNHVGHPNRFYNHSLCDDVEDGDNIWQSPASAAPVSLHWAAEMYHDYLGAQLNHDGLDGAGIEVKLVYHPTLLRKRRQGSGGWPWSLGDTLVPFNSYWDPQIDEAHFGRGDGISPFISLDVVAHELTHGLIDLDYPEMLSGGDEAKAMRESYCDIFSVCTEMYVLPLHDPGRLPNFQFGEDVANGPLRSMDEPWLYDCPRAVGGAFWQSSIGAEPHVNCSVQSYWFYLLAFGSAGKPVEDNASVCGVGLHQANIIAYRALTNYFATGATFLDGRQATISAASDVFGIGSFEAEQCANAWAAVGVGTGANFCNPVNNVESLILSSVMIAAYPNPVTDVLSIDLNVGKSGAHQPKMSMWSNAGQLIASISLPHQLPPGRFISRLDCTALPAGSYSLLYQDRVSKTNRSIQVIH